MLGVPSMGLRYPKAPPELPHPKVISAASSSTQPMVSFQVPDQTVEIVAVIEERLRKEYVQARGTWRSFYAIAQARLTKS